MSYFILKSNGTRILNRLGSESSHFKRNTVNCNFKDVISFFCSRLRILKRYDDVRGCEKRSGISSLKVDYFHS